MDTTSAQEFARQWADSWNRHDLEAVLAHFADDAVFSSPVAAQLQPETAGMLRGKDAIRRYWRHGLDTIPGLHFDVVDVYTGVDVIVITYRNHAGALVNEILELNGAGLVTRGHGTYRT